MKTLKKQKYYETDEFKQLQDEWYAKLQEDGFKDIEDHKTGFVEPPFRHRSYKADVQYEATEEYFRLCRHYLTNGAFKSDLDKEIWSMHTEGATYRNIAEKLSQHTTTVFRKVKRYKKLMKKGDKTNEKKDQ